MLSKLETVNNQNGKTKNVGVRIKHAQVRTVKDKNMDIFSCVLNTESRHYAQAEAVIFGTKPVRDKTAEALKSKWAEDSTWSLSKMTLVPRSRNSAQRRTSTFSILEIRICTVTRCKAKQLPIYP